MSAHHSRDDAAADTDRRSSTITSRISQCETLQVPIVQQAPRRTQDRLRLVAVFLVYITELPVGDKSASDNKSNARPPCTEGRDLPSRLQIPPPAGI